MRRKQFKIHDEAKIRQTENDGYRKQSMIGYSVIQM